MQKIGIAFLFALFVKAHNYAVIISDDEEAIVSRAELSLLLNDASNIVSLSAVKNDCSIVCTTAAVHLSHTCLSSSKLGLPAVTFPLRNSTSRRRCAKEISLKQSSEGQMKAAALVAQHFQFRNVFLWTDQTRAFAVFKKLGSQIGFRVNRLSENATQLLKLSHLADAVVSHCETVDCYVGFVKALKMWLGTWSRGQQEVTWIVTEGILWEIESNFAFWKTVEAIKLLANWQIVGIERSLDDAIGFDKRGFKKTEKCQLLSHSSGLNKQTQAVLASVYDTAICLKHYEDPETELFSENHCGSVVLDSAKKERLYTSYNVFGINTFTRKKIAQVLGSNLLTASDYYMTWSKPESRQRRQISPRLPVCPIKSGPPYHFVVTSAEEKPFFFKNSSGDYVGLVVDLMAELKKQMNFTYSFIPAKDNKYGNIEVDDAGTVNATGMMNQLLYCEADLAVGSLLVTSDREKYISFAGPCWMDAGLSLYGRREETKNRHLFGFLRPFSWQLWVMLLVVVVGYGFMVAITRLHNSNCNNCCSYFWRSVFESFWQLFAALSGNGPDTDAGNERLEFDKDLESNDGSEFLGKYRATWPSRFLHGGWFFFALIAGATYTANLATFLVSDTLPKGIQNLDQLADQTEVKYGTVWNSAVEQFFATSTVDKYQRMGKYMASFKNVMVETAEEGYERARNDSNYVFIWDTLSLEYAVSTTPDCNTRLIGREFNQGGYGLGMRQGQPYEKEFSLVLLQLRDQEVIAHLRSRWFHDEGHCVNEETDTENRGEPQPMTLHDFGGAFLILVTAAVLAIIANLLLLFAYS